MLLPLALATVAAAATAPSVNEVFDAPAPFDCTKIIAPPGDYLVDVGFASESEPDAVEKADERARAKLTRNICGEHDCSGNLPRLRLFKTARKDGSVCAMVTVPRAEAAEYKARLEAERVRVTADGLEQKFAELAVALIPAAAKGGELSVAIDKVEVNNNFGGPAAAFLRARMEVALDSAKTAKFVVRELPKRYTGEPRVPKGLHAVLSGVATSRIDKGERVLDVAWTAAVPDGKHSFRKKTALPVLIPSDAVGSVPPAPLHKLSLPTDFNGNLTVHLGSRSGGSICDGDVTQLYVTSKRNKFVQVFNLYGTSEALLTYSGPVPKGRAFEIGPGGMQIIRGKLPEESFIVVGSEKPNPVLDVPPGVLNCRLSGAEARRVWNWDRLPLHLSVAGDGYRIGDAEECGDRSSRKTPDELAAMVAELPLCTDAAVASDTP